MAKKRLNYSYRPGSRHPKCTAEQAGRELERIREKYGTLTADAVLTESKPSGALFHDELNWNDANAAHEWRLHQCRNIVNCVHVSIKGSPKSVTVQQFQVLSDSGAKDQQYIPTAEIMSEETLKKQLFDTCLRELLNVRDKYRALKAFEGIWQKVDELVDTLN